MEQLEVEVVNQLAHCTLVRRDPLPAELVRVASDLRVPHTPADTVARFAHDDLEPLALKLVRGGKPCNTGPDDDDIGVARAHRVRSSHKSLAQRLPQNRLQKTPKLPIDSL